MLKLNTLLFVAASYLIPAAALAADPVQGTPSNTQATNIIQNVTAGARLVITFLFVLALLVFVWGMVRLIIAAGDPDKIKEAKGFILWGLIGMAILASVFGIVTFIQSYFGVTGSGTFNIPTVTGPQ